MHADRPNTAKLITLQETARRLAVSVDTLLSWNEHDILTPKITKDGTVGYSEEQIAYFQSIQASFRNSLPSLEYEKNGYLPHEKQNASSTINEEVYKAHNSSNLFITLSLIGAVGAIVMLTQGKQISFLMNQFAQYQTQTTSQAKVLGRETSTLQFTPFNTFSTSVSLNSDGSKNKSLQNEGKNTAFVFYQQAKSTRINSSTSSSQVLAARIVNLEKTAGSDGSASAKFAPIAATIKSNDASTLSPLDGNGGNDISLDLGTLNTSNTIRNDTLTTTAAVGILGIMLFVLQSQLAVFGQKPRRTQFHSQSHSQPVEKILELEQKMDGSVVATFQGKEYKICKPELYSDSDQFIERLMELTSMEEKEIEYDSFTDARLRLSTPLSRIVTRLNFVGLKRDLFFPRTSKNRVLFRRYLTYQDLLTMNLTVANVLSDLTKVA